MIEVGPFTPLPPHVGARVRWQSNYGTKFGEVIAVDESGLLEIRVADSDLEVRLPAGVVALLSRPGGGR